MDARRFADFRNDQMNRDPNEDFNVFYANDHVPKSKCGRANRMSFDQRNDINGNRNDYTQFNGNASTYQPIYGNGYQHYHENFNQKHHGSSPSNQEKVYQKFHGYGQVKYGSGRLNIYQKCNDSRFQSFFGNGIMGRNTNIPFSNIRSPYHNGNASIYQSRNQGFDEGRKQIIPDQPNSSGHRSSYGNQQYYGNHVTYGNQYYNRNEDKDNNEDPVILNFKKFVRENFNKTIRKPRTEIVLEEVLELDKPVKIDITKLGFKLPKRKEKGKKN